MPLSCSYLYYSLVRPSCQMLLYLVPDVDLVAHEVECEEEAVEPPFAREWQPEMSSRHQAGL